MERRRATTWAEHLDNLEDAYEFLLAMGQAGETNYLDPSDLRALKQVVEDRSAEVYLEENPDEREGAS